MRILMVAIALAVAATSVFAQGFGGGIPGAPGGGTILLNTDKGLFALRAGVVAKYDTTTLKEVQTLPLLGPAPEAPTDFQDREAMQQYRQAMQMRQNALMIANADSLLIVIGDHFYRVNQETLKSDATADLHAADAAAGAPEPVPGYALAGNTLFLMRGKEMLSLNITDGKILARAPLSKAMQSAPPMGARPPRNNG